MYSITKVLVTTAILSDEQPALAARGWPDEKYSTTKVITTTPASCFSTPSSTVVKCSTTTPYVPKTETKCWTKTICSETTKMVEGTPITIKITSLVPTYTPMTPPKKPETWKAPPPKLTTSCTTKYSTVSGKTCSSTQTMVSVITPPAKQAPKLSTTCRTLYTTINGKPSSTTQKIISVITPPAKQPSWSPEAPTPTPSSSSSCKKTSTPLLWYPDGTTSVPAVAPKSSKSSAQSSKASVTSPAKSSSAQTSPAKATSSKATSSKATSTKISSNSTHSTSKFTMPTKAVPTMESSASSFGGVSMVLSAIAAVALAMAAL